MEISHTLKACFVTCVKIPFDPDKLFPAINELFPEIPHGQVYNSHVPAGVATPTGDWKDAGSCLTQRKRKLIQLVFLKTGNFSHHTGSPMMIFLKHLV